MHEVKFRSIQGLTDFGSKDVVSNAVIYLRETTIQVQQLIRDRKGWERHFDNDFESLVSLKRKYDRFGLFPLPVGFVFSSN